MLFLARFAGGTVASFEATRVATGNQNRNMIEINGDAGSIRFDFERMNELQWWDNTLPTAMRGWSRSVEMPGASARKSWAPPTPRSGKMATPRTMIPIPPMK